MNIHIFAGNEALRARDNQRAVSEFLQALEDDDPLVRRIATHRLYELCPEDVYASPQSYQRLYHRPTCPAKNRMFKRNITWFKDWRGAVAAGYRACFLCKPKAVVPYIS